MGGSFFEGIHIVIIIDNFQSTDGRSVSAGKLPFIDYADGISPYHAVHGFQRSLRNIEGVILGRTGKSQLVSGKSLKCSLNFIHIDAGAVRVDILRCFFSGR